MTISPWTSAFTPSRSCTKYSLAAARFKNAALSSEASGLPPVVQASPWMKLKSVARTRSRKGTSPRTTASSISFSSVSTSDAATLFCAAGLAGCAMSGKVANTEANPARIIRTPIIVCNPTAYHELSLRSQSESKQRMTGSYGYILSAVDAIRYRSHGDLASQGSLPQHRTVAAIERVEKAFPASGEDHVGSRGQDSTAGHVCHLELPLLLARVGVHRDDRARAVFGGPGVDETAL